MKLIYPCCNNLYIHSSIYSSEGDGIHLSVVESSTVCHCDLMEDALYHVSRHFFHLMLRIRSSYLGLDTTRGHRQISHVLLLAISCHNASEHVERCLAHLVDQRLLLRRSLALSHRGDLIGDVYHHCSIACLHCLPQLGKESLHEDSGTDRVDLDHIHHHLSLDGSIDVVGIEDSRVVDDAVEAIFTHGVSDLKIDRSDEHVLHQLQLVDVQSRVFDLHEFLDIRPVSMGGEYILDFWMLEEFLD
ncbi:hypothetical protein PMAYCL1PPCAC_17786 [Pristionchus mayeri]|uniref:Uncharacterized protein n=1 Tax=Pristionchus mayeri TaxID=1317129 RepID=A0AAN5CN98_9BILA|nr:hypothetical protein PMAYCL1PPCAC_17786 [Pristionchus mayeri]